MVPPQLSSSVTDDTIDSDLPPLQFPDEDFWNVFVTVANSTLEVWLRIIGTQYSVSISTNIIITKTFVKKILVAKFLSADRDRHLYFIFFV